MILSPEAEIAQFLRRLKYILFAGLIGWVVWLLAPILTPFVLALLLAWLGDPLVDRIERADCTPEREGCRGRGDRRPQQHERRGVVEQALALDRPKAAGQVYNIGSGEDRSVREVASLLAQAMGRPDLTPEIAGKARAGDIRHCIPDIAKARDELGFRPARDFSEGLTELAAWVAEQEEARDRVEEARRELDRRGLVA